MEKYYVWDITTKKYAGECESQIDPLESEKAGHTVYCGLPTNGTYEKPLAEKEGYDVIWNGNAWEYKEIPQPEPEPEPTPEDIQEHMRAIRNSYLSYWDFSQLCDAPFSEEEKDSLAAYRQYLRDYTKEEDWWMAEPLKYEDWLVGYKPISK